MFILDDLVLSPYRGVKWIFNKVHQLAEEEIAGEPERIKKELTELYRMLETGELTEDAFDQREQALLDRLDELEENDGVEYEQDLDEALEEECYDEKTH